MILLIEGFDLYNGIGGNIGLTTRWAGVNWFYNPQMTAGRFGGQGFMNGNGEGCATALALPTPVGPGYGVCHAFRINGLSGTNNTNTGGVIGISSAINTEQFSWRPRQDGSICFYRNGVLLYQTVAGVIQNNVFHFIECWGTLSATVGTINMKVDGVQVAAVTGLNNVASGTTTFFGMVFGGGMFGSSGGFPPNAVTIDDMYMTDGNTLGERKIETLRPNADTATKQFTPDSGTTNFSRVNATLGQTSTFVSAANVGNTDLYSVNALASVPAIVDAVNIISFAQKTDAAARSINLVADVAAVQIVSPNIVLPAAISKQNSLMLTRPGGGAWTAADISALKIGQKVAV